MDEINTFDANEICDMLNISYSAPLLLITCGTQVYTWLFFYTC